ncbi:MAG: FAD-dependent oxidoreductase [Kineosporiaceae bacterium]|nr:FAD-dependent oxidoreductase [Kineosporiaceae bacterium]MBK7621533.1 FAD-dependent oxidoreductase [Kineosporiaceae bacterium]
MSTVPSRARTVIIGSGIVGNSVAYHLARLGWRELVQIDKGPLPNPGGSTGHASNFIFPVDHSREFTDITKDSVAQYKELGVYTQSGGYEVARSAERMQELNRRITSAICWDIPAEIHTPEQVQAKVPFLDPSVIVGGFWSPTVGVVDSLRAGTIMRERAVEMGALTTHANVEVTGIDVEGGRVVRVRTDKGDIECETIVIACGVWSPKIATMAGVHIPLTPAVHQMISVGPVPELAAIPGEISFPIVRDMDTFCYERQHGSDMEVGSYAHRPILMRAEEIPSIEQSALSPTEMPFTSDDFDPQLEQALELMPDILGNPDVGIRYAINGLLSLTPDGFPVLGESPEVKGVWSAAAVWIKEGPGVGRMIAEWMVEGDSEIDGAHSDIARFYPHQTTRHHITSRTSEAFNKTYGIVHPSEQWSSNRDVRLAPMHASEKELGAVFFETAGWERPFWYASNEGLLAEYGDQVMPRSAEWDSRWWSPIINAEHLAMRERAGLFDLSAFCVFDVIGPKALDVVQRVCVQNMDVRSGRVVYTPVLSAKGGFKSDLTVMRLSENHFRVVTGGAHGNADRKWFADNAERAGGGAVVVDLTSAWTTIGVWGPKSRDILGKLTDDDISHAGFAFSSCREIEAAGLRVLASRISYVGELGWELYVPIETGARLWSALREAGSGDGLVPCGIGVYGTTGRLEKGYRAYGAELDGERTVVEAGMQRPKVKEIDFIGRDAYLAQREKEPASILCTLTVDDHTSSTGEKRYMLGGEPILTPDGEALVDGHGHRSYVTSAGSGPSVGKHLLLSYLPAAQAVEGTKLAVQYLGERYPVTVAVAGSTPLFDPENARIRA